MKHFKVFEQHQDYIDYIDSSNPKPILPNMSYCKNIDDVHFNTYIEYFTPKQLLEYSYNYYQFLKSNNLVNNIRKQTILYKTFIRNIITNNYNYTINDIRTNKQLIDIDISIDFQGSMKFLFDSYEGTCVFSIYTLNEEYNNNFICKIWDIEPTSGDFPFELWDNIAQQIKEHVILLIDKSVIFLNFQDLNYYLNMLEHWNIIYKNNNGEYTDINPTQFTFEFTDHITGNPENISMTLFHSVDEEINDRVDEAVIKQRRYPLKTLIEDFSTFSALDDIKIPIEWFQAEFIKYPERFFNID